MSELFDIQVNAQKEKNFRDSRKLPRKPTKKCAIKMKQTRKKRRAPKIFFDGRKQFIRRMQKTRVMDIKRLQVNDS